MKSESLLIIVVLLISFLIARGGGTGDQLTVVDSVNITKYAGLWYEIARIPNSFQKNCSGIVTAMYELRQDGKLNVINRCTREDGSSSKVKGIAKIVDPESNARLKVSFVQILGISLFWGDYWIIGLDENYEWAIVGSPGRKYGWILSREPEMADSTMQKIFTLLETKNYNPAEFILTNKQN
jgi:apolipoprotein D and lipocalin family protein